ncbi:MAG: hypothetical protein EP304_06275 [Deltaproteobacteria bacterium]|nr:MAG: hypothetical protein EP304_06275 [Deltaproteobacteria bacterium]
MPFLNSLPENTPRRLIKVIVRTIHLVAIAGFFGNAMTGSYETVYTTMTLVSGAVLTLMEASSGWVWFVQLRGVFLFIKLLILLLIHIYPNATVAGLIAVIALSGFISHAPSWIRYFSMRHWQVVHSKEDLLG